MGFNRVRTAVSSGGTGNVTLGAADDDCVDAADYAGMSGIPYLLSWSGGFEVGYGALDGDGVTFTRSTIVENQLGTTAAQSVPTSAKFSVTALAQSMVAVGAAAVHTPPNTGGNLGAVVVGPSAQASGVQAVVVGPEASGAETSVSVGNTSTAESSGVAVGSGATAGVQAVALGTGAVGVEKSIAIGGCVTEATGEYMIGNNASDCVWRREFIYNTTNATTQAANVMSGATPPIVADDGAVFYAEVTVLAVQFNQTTFAATKAKVIKLSALFGATGVLTTVATPTTVYNFGSFGATATLSVTSGGQLNINVTGVAATEVDWRISVELRKLYSINY